MGTAIKGGEAVHYSLPHTYNVHLSAGLIEKLVVPRAAAALEHENEVRRAEH